MAKETGISLYRCDRCSASEYLKEGDPSADAWRLASRVMADGTTISRFFCADCAGEYKALATSQDAAFSEFMKVDKEA